MGQHTIRGEPRYESRDQSCDTKIKSSLLKCFFLGIISRLVASHLHLIIGKEAFKTCNRRDLYKSISSEVPLSDSAQNLVWITNRQNGKTSTLSRFIAALAVASPVGGQLATIYSTSLDRSVELKKGALQYIQWLTSNEGRCDEFPTIRVLHNNYTTFGVTTGHSGGPVNMVNKRTLHLIFEAFMP